MGRKIYGVVVMILGVLIALIPRFLAPVCEYSQTPGMAAAAGMVMNCHWLVPMAVGLGAAVLLVGFAFFLLPGGFAAGLHVAMIVLGLLLAALPTVLIGVCSVTEGYNIIPVCRSSTRPMLLIAGGIVAVLGILGALLSALGIRRRNRKAAKAAAAVTAVAEPEAET